LPRQQSEGRDSTHGLVLTVSRDGKPKLLESQEKKRKDVSVGNDAKKQKTETTLKKIKKTPKRNRRDKDQNQLQ